MLTPQPLTSDFLKLLVPTDAEGYLDLRSFKPHSLHQLVRMDDPNAMKKIQRWVTTHSLTRDLYMGVAERRTGENGKKANCSITRALHCEIDFKDQSEQATRSRLAAFRFLPSIVIASGGGLHCYWLLDEPAQLAEDGVLAKVEAAIKWLQVELGGDKNAIDASRVLRIPNTINHKYENKPRVVIEVFEPARRYPLSSFRPSLRVPVNESGPSSQRSTGIVDIERAVELLASTFPAVGSGVHYYILKIAGWFAHAGIELADALVVIGRADGKACQGTDAHADTRRAIEDTYSALEKSENIEGLPSALAQVPALEMTLEDLKRALGIEAVAPDHTKAAELPAEEATARLSAARLAAKAVLEHSDPLALVVAAVRGQHYGGDVTPILITYLSMTSRVLVMRLGHLPVHLMLIASSGGGKTYCVKVCCLFMPADAIHPIPAGSARALIYDAGDLRHRVVDFGEADSLPKDEENSAASAIRAMLQDHELSYNVVERGKDGKFATRRIVRPGPSVLITTGTKPFADSQMRTRVFELEVPEDFGKLTSAIKAQAILTNDAPPTPDAGLVAFQEVLQLMAPWDVVIPYAGRLAELITRRPEAMQPRIMRDFARILSLIKAVTVVRHAGRERDAAGRVVATLADYRTVLELAGPMYEASAHGISAGVRRVVEAFRAADTGHGVTKKTVADQMAGAEVSRPTLYRWIGAALKGGWLVNTADKGQPWNLTLGEPLPPAGGLPSLAEMGEPQPSIPVGETHEVVEELPAVEGELLRGIDYWKAKAASPAVSSAVSPAVSPAEEEVEAAPF